MNKNNFLKFSYQNRAFISINRVQLFTNIYIKRTFIYPLKVFNKAANALECSSKRWKISYLWERQRWWRGGLANFYCDDGSDCGSPHGLVASDASPSLRRSTCRHMSLERRNISLYYRATSPIKADRSALPLFVRTKVKSNWATRGRAPAQRAARLNCINCISPVI